MNVLAQVQTTPAPPHSVAETRSLGEQVWLTVVDHLPQAIAAAIAIIVCIGLGRLFRFAAWRALRGTDPTLASMLGEFVSALFVVLGSW